MEEELRKQCSKASQSHVFTFYDTLTEQEQESLLQQLQSIDLNETIRLHKELASGTTPIQSGKISPLPSIISAASVTDKEHKMWNARGYEELAKGRAGVLLLAGGQGTRLGSSLPKGMYNIGLPSQKTLFQIQAERLRKLEELTEKETNTENVKIPWFIMLSSPTEKETKQFFEKHNFWGLDKDQVVFFTQGELPCLTPDGKMIMAAKNKVQTAPNGNGGLYSALKERGVLKEMEKRGIRWIHSYCVDNILIKIGDPYFVGFCAEKDIDCAAKVIAKSHPEERVGVLCLQNGKPAVMEYTEISEKKSKERDENGQLVYNWAHIVLNSFSLDFLKKICDNHLSELPFHRANKKITHIDLESGETIKPSEPNGIKAELFVFDVFPFSTNMHALEVDREEEFSPLKNAPGSERCTPEECRNNLSKLHKSYIEKAGGTFSSKRKKQEDGTSGKLCEISPLLSYAGEGLEEKVKGKEFNLPLHLE